MRRIIDEKSNYSCRNDLLIKNWNSRVLAGIDRAWQEKIQRGNCFCLLEIRAESAKKWGPKNGRSLRMMFWAASCSSACNCTLWVFDELGSFHLISWCYMCQTLKKWFCWFQLWFDPQFQRDQIYWHWLCLHLSSCNRSNYQLLTGNLRPRLTKFECHNCLIDNKQKLNE